MHLFAGAGGGILADILLGHQPVCAVEIEPYCQQVLHARQQDGFLPWFPIFGDVKEFNGKPWRGLVDVICGGFPCQDISTAGEGLGIDGPRSGLWREMVRLVREVGPRIVFVENSPALTSRGLGRVLGDLATLGYDARWCVLGANDVGAPHRRKRIWIMAHTNLHDIGHVQGVERAHQKLDVTCQRGPLRDTDETRLEGSHDYGKVSEWIQQMSRERCWWAVEPELGRVVDGMAGRVDRLKAIGNGQVPACAALAWRTLIGDLN